MSLIEKDQTWTDAQRSAWRLPERLTVSEWADANRMLDEKTAAEPGRWSTDRTPYLREIMDAFCDPYCEEITIMKPTQVGGTEAIYNMIGYSIDQDPAPTGIVMPDEAACATVSSNRIRPMIELSPSLASHITDCKQDLKTMEFSLKRMTLYFMWAGSPSKLASKPICNLFLDEVDKFPLFSGNEANPIKLAYERTRTFRGRRKIVKASTPTTRRGYIIGEYESSDRRRWWCQCARCGHWQTLVKGESNEPGSAGLKYPSGVAPEAIVAESLATYECAGCGARMGDFEFKKMVRRGKWVPDGEDAATWDADKNKALHSRHRGYWFNCFVSPWLTLSEIAAEWLRSCHRTDTLMNFINSWLAEEWRETTEVPDKEKLRERILLGNPIGSVPAEALVLTAGVDVQKDHFYYSIHAWGYDEEQWVIQFGRVETWPELEHMLFEMDYPSLPAAGFEPHRHKVRLVAIDSRYRTHEVYNWARRWGQSLVRVIMGERGGASKMAYRVASVDKHPVNGQPLPGALRRWMLNTYYYKDKLARMMRAAPGTIGQLWLPAGTTDDYLAQLTSEEKVRDTNKKTGEITEYWAKKASSAENHQGDCAVYALFAAEVLRVQFMRRQQDQPSRPAAPVAAPKAGHGFVSGAGGFVKSGGGFVSGKGWIR